jgi:hypothetical protein
MVGRQGVEPVVSGGSPLVELLTAAMTPLCREMSKTLPFTDVGTESGDRQPVEAIR